MIKRILSYLIILFSILFLPYWLYVPVIIVISIVIPFFWEAILFGFLIDVLYGDNSGDSFPLLSLHALAALIIVVIAGLFRERLRFNV